MIIKNFILERQSYPLSLALTYEEDTKLKGYLFYLHGGGLLFGTKGDLPAKTIEFYCKHGFGIIGLDYGLSPYTKIPEILTDIQAGVYWFLDNQDQLPVPDLPWYLWGRSAGAYLCLISTLLKKFPYPKGILSNYGYSFLEPDWYLSPSPYYKNLPLIPAPDYEHLSSQGYCTCATPDKRYELYAFARQSGNWIPAFYNGKIKDFLREYTFLLHEIPSNYPPVFLTHALEDPDVPYTESKRLNEILPISIFHPVSSKEHDFDKNTSSYAVRNMLEHSLEFLEKHSGL